jgi:hypothetical protein
MSLRFQCDGSDISGISALKARLDTLAPIDARRLEAMSDSEDVVRVWMGPDLPADARAWIVEAQHLPEGESLMSEHPHLNLLALIHTPSGLVPEMHVVHERSRTPVYFQSRSELEGYFAERLASIQEVN